MSSAVKLKYKVDPIRRGNPPSYVDNDGIPVVNQGCVWPSGLDSSKFKQHNPEEIGRIDAWLRKNDVLVNSTGTGTLGRVCHLKFEPETDIFADGHVTILRDSKGMLKTRYLFYVLSIQQERITVECSEGATNQIELSRSLLGNLKLEWPMLETQTKIANYLDRKTAELDQLIGSKQRLLKLLDEKKRALIARAVTRGLNPDVPLKDSGVHWLGMIPTHWEIERARWLFVQSDLPVREKDEMVTCFRDGIVTLRSNRRVAGFTNAILELSYQGIRKGQLVLHSMDAFAGAIGVSDSDGKCTPEYVICDPTTDKTDSSYYGLLLREMALQNFIQAHCSAVRERAPRIRFNQFKDFELPVPPIEEQKLIVKHIQQSMQSLEQLQEVTKKTIALLQERRTALISAAVTGKLSEEVLNAG